MAEKAIFFGGRAYLGKENAGGSVKFYQSGDTSTPKAVFTDSTYQPGGPVSVAIDDNGFCTARLLGDYSVIVFNKNGKQLYQEDSINPQEDAESVSYNMIINGSFETDSDNDDIPDDFTLTEYDATQTNALDDTDSSHGERSMLFTSAGTGGGYITSTDYFLVSDLQTLQMNLDLKSSVVDVRNLVEMLWFESDKSAMTPTSVYDESAANPAAWVRKSFNVIPPTNARFAKIRLHGCHSSDVTVGNTRYDNVSLVEILPTVDLTSNEIEIVVYNPGEYSDDTMVRYVPQFPWSAPVKLANPTTLPALTSEDVTVSPNGEFVTVCHANTPYITTYQRSGIDHVKLANPAALPAGTATGVDASGNGEFLAVSHATTPYVTIYQRSLGVYTKLTDPISLPTGAGQDVAFSPNGEFLAVPQETAPNLKIYRRAGATPTVFDNVSFTGPTSDGINCAWSHDGRFLAVTLSNSPYLAIYERSGSVFTQLSDPATAPTGFGHGCAWSPDSVYLYVGHETTPFITIYKRSGTTFTKINDPASLPAGNVDGVEISPSGQLLAVTHATTPFIAIYSKNGDSFTKLADPSTLPAGTANGCAWSPNNEFLYVAHQSSPYVTMYQTASDMPDIGRATLRKIERHGS